MVKVIHRKISIESVEILSINEAFVFISMLKEKQMKRSSDKCEVHKYSTHFLHKCSSQAFAYIVFRYTFGHIPRRSDFILH